MKSLQKAKPFLRSTESKGLTLGDLIAATYGASGERGTGKILQFAMAANVIRYSRSVPTNEWSETHMMSGYACYPDESDSILVPEEVLKSLLGVSGVDLMSETAEVADENGWTVKPASEGYWLFKRKSAADASPTAQRYSVETVFKKRQIVTVDVS